MIGSGVAAPRGPYPVRSPLPVTIRSLVAHSIGNCATIGDLRRGWKGLWLCGGGWAGWCDVDMTFSGPGSPSDDRRIQLAVVGVVPECDDTAAAPHHDAAAAPHHDPRRASMRPRPIGSVIPRTAHLALAGRRRQAAAGRAAPRSARPEDGRGPEWERCDDIVQRLFAIGVAMQISWQLCGDRPELAARITGHMNDLQGMIHQIRSTVLDPRTVRPQSLRPPRVS